MYENDMPTFYYDFHSFLDEIARTQPAFSTYFRRHWVDSLQGKGYTQWAACYQPNVFMNMQTKNYCESWHNQLKQLYLKRKRIQRFDMLLNVLSEDVAFDITREVKRLSVNVGRMGVYEHQLRKKKSKSTRSKSLFDHPWYINYRVPNILAVPLLLAITAVNNQLVKCSCPRFVNTLFPCKHMFLVEHQLKTATVRSSYEQQQVWTDHLTVQHEEGRLPAPQPITANDKLEDAVHKLHRKTADIKRLIS
ncbi:hypothetical protein BDC45DRAFT_566629 [Circinella umbellata]|nr:hypothetical protein BDC45DRAFT_566629 [Circinella umbellata]